MEFSYILLSANFFDRFAPAVLTFLISLFLFIISRKERTALYLGFTFAALTVFNVGYLLGYGLDHPAGAAGWHIACVIVLVVLFKIQFVYYLPEKLNKYEPRIVLWTGLLIYLLTLRRYIINFMKIMKRRLKTIII